MTVRTTLTIEDDVATRLREKAHREGRAFKDVVNDALRAGLNQATKEPSEPYRLVSRNMGLRPGIDLDDIQGLLDRLDGPERR